MVYDHKEKDKNALEFYKNNFVSIEETCEKFHICAKRFKHLLDDNDIKKRDTRIKHNLDIDYFKEINTNEKAYWLGFILADGCIKKNNTVFQLTLSEKDKEHLETFNRCIKNSSPLIHEIRSSDKKYNYVIRIYQKSFCDNLINLGITERKSTKEKIPLIENRFYIDLIRGIFDGDGWISIGKTSEFGICSSKEVCLFIQNFLMENYNIKANLGLNNTKKNNNLYRIRVQKLNSLEKLKDILYYSDDLICLKRKYEKWNFANRNT